MDTRTVSMETKGVMQQIREHLAQGRSAQEVMALGYKPPTVYKMQRQLSRRSQDDGRVSVPGSAQPPATVADNQLRSELEAENIRLRQEVENLEGQLECVVDADAEAAVEVQTLRERVKALEPEATAAGQLRQRVKELEGQLQLASHTQAAMRQEALHLQGSVHAERASHQITKAQANAVSQENQGLHGKLEEWQQWGAKAQSVTQLLTAEVEQLRPLKVWAGHPCKVCKRPLPGIVSREDAAKAMENFGHTDCLSKQKSGLGKLLLAGGALYGLSRLR